MAQHDLGGSCTAHRYCHSDARISGHVTEEHGGVSANSATMIELTFWMRKRQSSYSHSVLSTFSGGSASFNAISLSTAMVPLAPIGCVRKLCRALRCSVSWKAESICALYQYSSLLLGNALRTSARSSSGGPSAISSAFVPGRILRAALWSRSLKNFCCSGLAGTGESWSSGIGGGLGRRGEAGDAIFGVLGKVRGYRDVACLLSLNHVRC
jgi:hypothetical protein